MKNYQMKHMDGRRKDLKTGILLELLSDKKNLVWWCRET